MQCAQLKIKLTISIRIGSSRWWTAHWRFWSHGQGWGRFRNCYRPYFCPRNRPHLV